MKKEEIYALLETHNIRKTPAIIKIISLFSKTIHPLSADDVKKHLKSVANQATIYRILQKLHSLKILSQVHISTEKSYYELKNREHHHHLICTTCTKIHDIPCSENTLQVIKPDHYNFSTIHTHSLEYFGICNECTKRG